MDLLNAFGHLLGLNQDKKKQQPQAQQPIPVGQPIPQSRMNSYTPQVRQQAEIYNANPQDARVAHVDPSIFGYAADDTKPALNVGQAAAFNRTQMGLDVQGIQNPGYTPLQNSGFGSGGTAVGLQPTLDDLRKKYRF